MHFAGADKIVLAQDNLSTHTPPSLNAAFPPAEARRLVERFEWHYTPKLDVLAGQRLDQRFEDKAMLVDEAVAWNAERNARHPRQYELALQPPPRVSSSSACTLSSSGSGD